MVCVHARQSELEKMGASALSKLVLAQMDRIEHLELMLAKLQRQHFGPKSEKAPINANQLMLSLSGTVIEAQPVVPEPPPASEDKTTRPPRKSRALLAHLRREVRTHFPQHATCPCCSGELRKLGEDVSEMLEYMPASFFVIRHVRPKMSCRKCSCVVQAPAPQRVIDRGLPGPGLLAHVITAKYADHTPLYRQSQIFAREGVELERSVLARWVGEGAALLTPLAEVLRRYVLNTEKLHGDDRTGARELKRLRKIQDELLRFNPDLKNQVDPYGRKIDNVGRAVLAVYGQAPFLTRRLAKSLTDLHSLMRHFCTEQQYGLLGKSSDAAVSVLGGYILLRGSSLTMASSVHAMMGLEMKWDSLVITSTETFAALIRTAIETGDTQRAQILLRSLAWLAHRAVEASSQSAVPDEHPTVDFINGYLTTVLQQGMAKQNVDVVLTWNESLLPVAAHLASPNSLRAFVH